jgi:hypothetical protein
VTHQNFTSQTTTTPGARSRRPRLLTAIFTAACAAAALVALPVQAEVASATSVPAAISAVGSPYNAVNATQLTVAPQTAGDLMVISFFINGTNASTSVKGVTGGGVNLWKEDIVHSDEGYIDAIWWGVIASPSASSTVSVDLVGSDLADEIVAQEYTAGPGVTWLAAEPGFRPSASTTIVFPKLTTTTPEELYFGYGFGSGIASAGSTPGFSYSPTQAGNIITWDTNVSGSVMPTAPQTGDGATAVAGLFWATTSAPPPSISAIGQLYGAQNSTSLPVSPEILGDLMELAVAFNGGTSGATVTSVSGGGVGSWAKSNTASQNGEVIQLWWGVVTTTGPFTVDLTTTGTFVTEEVVAQEFHAGANITWSLVGHGQAKSATSTVLFPNLPASNPPDLYFGYAVVAGEVLSGCTTGFSLAMTPDGNLLCWDWDYSGSKGPVASQSGQGSEALANLFSVSASAAPEQN